MKRHLLLLLLLPLGRFLSAQAESTDAEAILILDRMSEVIGELNACSFTLHTAYDVPDNDFFTPMPGLGLIKHFDKHQVYLTGPDKLMVNSNGDKGHWGYWFNGQTFDYFSYTENNYSLIQAPGTIMDVVYALNKQYNLEFPAADFFYPTFVDDLLENNTMIKYLGATMVNGQNCFHIATRGKEKTMQFWISNDAKTLPVKLVIVYHNQEQRPQYEATFSDWQINPDIPSTFFEFLPPPNANEIRFIPNVKYK